MKKVVLIFPDNLKLSEFLNELQIPYAEAHSQHHSLVAPLNSDQILIACKKYEGQPIPFYQYKKSFPFI